MLLNVNSYCFERIKYLILTQVPPLISIYKKCVSYSAENLNLKRKK